MGGVAGALIVDIVKYFPSGARVAARFETAVEAGSIAVLFGPSGAGKTTIVRCVAGLERPDRGRIEFGGDVWFDGDAVPAQARRVGYVGQEPALFPHLSVRGNVE